MTRAYRKTQCGWYKSNPVCLLTIIGIAAGKELIDERDFGQLGFDNLYIVSTDY